MSANEAHATRALDARRPRLDFVRVRPEDADLLVTMSRAMNAEDGHPLGPEAEAAARLVAAGEPLAPCWIIHACALPAGYVVLTLGFSIENGGRDGFLDEIYLVPDQRGGRGDTVMAFVEAAARELGVRNLYLEVTAENALAAALYRRRGFTDLWPARRIMHLPLA